MPFFDFHIHPSMKSLFTDPPNKFSPWDTLDTSSIPTLLRWCTEFRYILRSQANLSQLHWNECKLLCVALYAPEKAMLNNKLILGQATGKMGKYINEAKVKKIINNKLKPYDLVVNDDLKTLLNPQNFGVHDKKVVPLWDAADFDENRTDTIYVVFSVEGCHSFSDSIEALDVNTIISNIDDLATRVPLISINLTHMEQYDLCNMAYGMQFIPNKEFKPTGFALSSDGARIVNHCYRKKIAIDIKHMSLGARHALYQLRKAPDMQAINQPIICTHAGFTGIAMSEYQQYVWDIEEKKRAGYKKVVLGKPFMRTKHAVAPAFNPSSINLFDEDIMAILQSKGVIGISLDKRILGYDLPEGAQEGNHKTYALEMEYTSNKEDAFFFTGKTGAAFKAGKCTLLKDVSEATDLYYYHLCHFMAHILHLIRVAQKNNYDVDKALTQVCIGSDFDGMINPLAPCMTVDNLVYFKESFEKCFEDFAKECKISLPQHFNVKKFSDNLFYENGKGFVMERLGLI